MVEHIRWFERLEARWGAVCEDVRSVFRATFEVLRIRLYAFLILSLSLLLLRVGWKQSTLFVLRGEWQVVGCEFLSWLEVFIRFALYVVAYRIGFLATRKKGRRVSLCTFWRGYWNAFPYAMGGYLAYEYVWGYVAYGVNQAFESIPWMRTGHVGMFLFFFSPALLPALYFAGRLSFSVIGRAVGRTVSLRDSWRMTAGVQWAIFIWILLWWMARQALTILLIFSGETMMSFLKWLITPYPVVISFFFAISFGVLFARLDSSHL